VVDIVNRLRGKISKHGYPYPVEWFPDLQEAADEIERLRAELESVGLELRARMDAADELAATIRKLQMVQAERDEARREICMAKAPTMPMAQDEYAASRGWDCYRD
jgi:hypothetical protein